MTLYDVHQITKTACLSTVDVTGNFLEFNRPNLKETIWLQPKVLGKSIWSVCTYGTMTFKRRAHASHLVNKNAAVKSSNELTNLIKP
jgi:hypothetical protein